jgi:hypothetical protein
MRILTAIALSTLFATSSFAAAGGTKSQPRTGSVRRISDDAKPSEAKPAEGGETKAPAKKSSKKKPPKKTTEAPAAETPAK